MNYCSKTAVGTALQTPFLLWFRCCPQVSSKSRLEATLLDCTAAEPRRKHLRCFKVFHLRARTRKRKPGSARRLCRDGGRPLRSGGSGHRWAKLQRNGPGNVTFTGRQLYPASQNGFEVFHLRARTRI